MKQSLVIYFFLFLACTVSAQPLSSKELKDLRGSTEASCFATQRGSALSKSFTDQQIHGYCNCYSNELFLESFTVKDMIKMNDLLLKQGAEAPGLLELALKGRDMYSIANACALKMIK